MAVKAKRSVFVQALPWLIVALMVAWIAFEVTPRPVRAELGLVRSVDRFNYDSWHSELELTATDRGVATLAVTETIVADFPESDTNKGIVRGVPMPTPAAPSSFDVTDENGASVPFTTEYSDSDGILYILTGTESYVHGTQTYVIEYSVSQDMFLVAGSDMQELHWNLLPLDSAQSIGEFSSTVRIDPELADSLNGHSACYEGRYGSTDRCELTESDSDDDAVVFEFSSGHRGPGDGVTMGIGFENGTFSDHHSLSDSDREGHSPGFFDRYATVSMVVALLTLALAFAVGLSGIVSRRIVKSDPHYGHEVAAANTVPSSMTPLVAATLMREAKDRSFAPENNAISSHIVHLAVQGAIKFESRPSDGDTNNLRVRLVNPDAVDNDLDQRMLRLLCPGLKPDSVHKIPQDSSTFTNNLRSITTQAKTTVKDEGLMTRGLPQRSLMLVGILGPLLALFGVFLVFNLPEVTSETDEVLNGLAYVAAIVFPILTVSYGWSVFQPPLQPSRAGWDSLWTLKATRAYMDSRIDSDANSNAAEPAAHEHDTNHDEKLLPYAKLFGIGDQWESYLEKAYKSTKVPPAWLDDVDGNFRKHWGDISQQLYQLTNVSSSSDSSGSSSSGGGGGSFSGGGGGGGFSGGR